MTSTFPSRDLEVLPNRTFDEIALGESASIERTLTNADLQLFAAMSGDVDPQHLDTEFAASTRFQGGIAHGMWGAALISAVLGTRLPIVLTSRAGSRESRFASCAIARRKRLSGMPLDRCPTGSRVPSLRRRSEP